MRAGVQNPDMVGALGISLQPYMTAVAALGVGLAGLAGVLLAPISGVHPAMGAEILTAAFVVVVIGGLGSFWGVIAAAALVGVVRGVTIYFNPSWGEASMYLPDGARPPDPAARPARRAHPEVRVDDAAGLRASRSSPRWRSPCCRSRSIASACRCARPIDVVVFAIACLGLNVLVGYTGLVSFGHGAWFGLAAYAAALSQRHWFGGSIVLPALFAILFIAGTATLAGALILRRRGVYFSLLTLALTALLFAVAYRWTDFTGGESGLGGVTRATVLGVDLERDGVYYWLRRRRRLRRRVPPLALPPLARRARPGGDPRERAAGAFRRLSDQPLQAARLRHLGDASSASPACCRSSTTASPRPSRSPSPSRAS